MQNDFLERQLAAIHRELNKPPRHSYFVVMQDFGRRGLEANVHPEDTRAAVVDMIRRKDHFGPIAFIHHVEVEDSGFGRVHDVTNELLAEAGFYEEAV